MGNRTGEELQRLKDQRRIIESVSRFGPDGNNPDRLMHHVAAQVARITRVEHSKVMRYRRERGDLIVEAGVGWKPHVVGNAVLTADYSSPAGRSVQTGAPVMIEDIVHNAEFHYPEILKEHGVISVLNVPVMINGEMWGVLEIDSAHAAHFDEWDVSFMTIVANIMGICIGLQDVNAKHVEAIADAARQRKLSEMAMRELQHRIKNNLQIIVGFLLSKTREEQSTENQEKLKSVVGRVQAVAFAHDLLSVGEDRSKVKFDDYLRSLCLNVGAQRPDVTMEIEADAVELPIDRAVAAGLVVNELVTNSLKYAFGNRGGAVKVHFQLISDSSEGCIAVEDDGIGMEVPPQHKGFGLQLIEGLAQQVQGRIAYTARDRGSRTVLCFPIGL